MIKNLLQNMYPFDVQIREHSEQINEEELKTENPMRTIVPYSEIASSINTSIFRNYVYDYIMEKILKPSTIVVEFNHGRTLNINKKL